MGFCEGRNSGHSSLSRVRLRPGKEARGITQAEWFPKGRRLFVESNDTPRNVLRILHSCLLHAYRVQGVQLKASLF
jgi:hypothetical protein